MARGSLSLLIASGVVVCLSACSGGGSNNNPPPRNPTAPTVTVTPSSSSVTTVQGFSVAVAVTGSGGTATGTVELKSGTYTSAATALAGGSATIQIAAGTLAAGTDALTASYTPDSASSSTYTTATGNGTVTVTPGVTPTVTVTPSTLNTSTAQDLKVTVAVTAPSGDATPTGSVALSSGTYQSAATTLASGSATIDIPAFTLAAGSYAFSAAYTPDTASAGTYGPASGTSGTVTVTQMSTVSVNQGVTGPALSDTLLGMNLAVWYDIDTNKAGIQSGFSGAGIKTVRWPGGSTSDEYHWKNNSYCSSYADPHSTYTNFINDVQIPLGADVALTANYGTDVTCNGPGDPTEAAGWVQAWEAAGGTISHLTVGNEVYGSWETDMHSKPHDPTTYASATVSGYYPGIKAVDKNVLVGVVVDAGCTSANGCTDGWDQTVLANAKGSYDFVEFHYYPQAPGQEDDTFLVQSAAQGLASDIKTIEQELQTAGTPGTPIYVGEIGSVYSNPGKQSWSITQGLYAGQVLGEMMNAGVERLTWWIGYGNCFGTGQNDSASLYGWQNFGAYNVFADGAGDTGPDGTPCNYGGPIGTMSPTARAFQLFGNVAVNGESALAPPVVQGDTADVRAYAATHAGGTALVLFNLNQTTSEPVTVSLSAEQSSKGVTVITYSKAIYDDSQNGKWDPPTTTNMGAQNLPLSLTLDPWSMNVVVIQ